MASSTSNKSQCITCGKGTGTFSCRGCSQDFCLTHAQEHRRLLGKQMDEDIIFQHDQLQHSLNEQLKNTSVHPLMKEIDEWEKQSIEKIRQNAEENRRILLRILNSNTETLKTTLTSIKNVLTIAREEDAFFESDLTQWKQQLEELKNNLNRPQTIIITQDTNANSLVPKLSVTEKLIPSENLEKCLGDVQIQDNGKLFIHGNLSNYSVLRGKGEYSIGKHHFRFKIESMTGARWILFAIVSKGAPIQMLSYSTPTTYGWAGSNQVYLNGTNTLGYNGYKTDMETNHTIEFTVDCDKRKISLKNEQTQSKYEIDIDITKCPFPWQISLNLYHAGDRIRLLQ